MDGILVDMEFLQNTAENSAENGTEQLYCICRRGESSGFMIMCDYCGEWFHGDCVNVTQEHSEKIDIYCCLMCKRIKPGSKTTYKDEGKSFRMEAYSYNDSSPDVGNANPTSNNTSCFDFVDTTVRKAKTNAYVKFKSKSSTIPTTILSNKKKTKRIKQPRELKQCYGPGCQRPSRKGTKGCSETCGVTLAQNRLIEILPQRIYQWRSSPSAADESDRKKLTSIREQQIKIKKEIEEVDVKIIQLIHRINLAKDSSNIFEEFYVEDSMPFECILCGIEIQKNIEKHLELCYKRSDRQVIAIDNTPIPNDMQWNIYCNEKLAKNVFCKKLKVLCSMHYQSYNKKDDEVCGFPLFKQNGVIKHCGNIGKNCVHINWEEKLRAQLDLEKLNLVIKLSRLQKEESNIRSEMAKRGGVLGLMLHQTIAH